MISRIFLSTGSSPPSTIEAGVGFNHDFNLVSNTGSVINGSLILNQIFSKIDDTTSNFISDISISNINDVSDQSNVEGVANTQLSITTDVLSVSQGVLFSEVDFIFNTETSTSITNDILAEILFNTSLSNQYVNSANTQGSINIQSILDVDKLSFKESSGVITISTGFADQQSSNENSTSTIQLSYDNDVTGSSTVDASGSINVSGVMSSDHGLTSSINVEYNPTVNIGSALTVNTLTQAFLNENISLGLSNILSSTSGKEIVTAISMGLQSSSSFSSLITIEGGIGLGLQTQVYSENTADINGLSEIATSFLYDVATASLTEAQMSLGATVEVVSNGINPAIVIRIAGGKQILLSTNVSDLLVSNSSKEIIITN